jgi:hypothetical protein
MNEGQPPPIPPANIQSENDQFAYSQVSGPATGLLVVAIIDLAARLSSVLISFIGISLAPMLARPGLNPNMPHFLQGAVSGSFSLVGLVVSGFVVFAALEMRQLKQWELCVAASIIYMIPFFSACCILGIPFAIWSLVVLLKPEVKAAFRRMSP